MIQIKDLIEGIDKLAKAFFNLFDTITQESDEVRQALEDAANGALSQEKAKAALETLNGLIDKTGKAKVQVAAFAPTYKTPETEEEVEPTPVEEGEVEDIVIQEDDSIGLPGVPSISFNV